MTGTLTISVEIELGWGVHDLPYDDHLSSDGAAEREYLDRFLRAADRYDVPVSFDIVGHLLLDECDGRHDGPHPEGWFDSDPGTDAERDPLFYAPDTARNVLDADVDHELCTHTFSHVICDQVDRAVVDDELGRARALHEAVGAPVRSIVPPRHHRPPNDLLREHGIRAARYALATDSGGRMSRLKELTVGPHPLMEPEVVDGVLQTYGTTYPSLTASSLPSGQSETPPMFRPLPLSVRKRIHGYYLRRSTRRAIEEGTPLHLWCHLYDFSNPHQFEVLADYLDFVASLPEDELAVLTMSDLADEYLGDVGAAGTPEARERET